MNTSKMLKGTIAGGIVFFFLGWLVYGQLLTDVMESSFNKCMARSNEDMILWAMILANLSYAALLTMVFSWARVDNVMEGVKKGAIFVFILSLTMAFYQHSMTTMYENMSAMVVEVLVGTAVAAVASAVIAWAMNMGTKA